MSFRTGHLPDHAEVVKRRKGLHLFAGFAGILALSSALPMATQNRAKLSPSQGGPGILDQDGVGACEGHAHASGGTLRLALLGQSQGLISPTMLYTGALLFDQTLNPDGTLSTVRDAGTMPSSIDSAWQTFGAVLAKDDPLYPCRSATLYVRPGDPNSPLRTPGPDQLYAASPYRFSGTYFITAQGPGRLLQALSVLAAGRPITDAIPASDQAFQQFSGGSVLGALAGPIDHANLIVDYEWTGSVADWATFLTALQQNDTTTVTHLAKDLVFHCVNSWSEGWGEGDTVAGVPGGMYRADVSYFNQAEDLSVVDIQAAA